MSALGGLMVRRLTTLDFQICSKFLSSSPAEAPNLWGKLVLNGV
jgi:hypothetical protein